MGPSIQVAVLLDDGKSCQVTYPDGRTNADSLSKLPLNILLIMPTRTSLYGAYSEAIMTSTGREERQRSGIADKTRLTQHMVIRQSISMSMTSWPWTNQLRMSQADQAALAALPVLEAAQWCFRQSRNLARRIGRRK
jgi:hypothetical protein